MDPLCCQICKKVFNAPTTIPCGHSFCMSCIEDCWTREESCGSISCPECKRTFNSKPQLVQNQTLTYFTNLLSDTRMSESVQNQNERKRRSSTSGADNPPHLTKIPCSPMDTSTAPGTSNKNMCLKHNKELNLYCYDDKQVICLLCVFFEHTTHRTGNVSDERQKKQEELKSIMEKNNEMLMAQENKLKNLSENDYPTQIKQVGARNTADYCESVFTQLIDTLQKCYGMVKRKIEAEASLQRSLTSLELNTEALRKQVAELNQLACIENDVHFLQKWPSSFYTIDDQTESSPLHHYERIKTAVDKFGKQMEEFCQKEITSLCPTVSSTSYEADIQPKTRVEFLKYACELTLDPDTAHGDLLLSNKNREVKLIPHTRNDRAASHPERFSRRRQVLCKEGLQAARCYYEVEVDGDKAEIALAYKIIDRKSSAKSAFGANEHSWSLDRSDIYSVCHKGDGIQLTAKPKAHQKIGIYLQFSKEGSLSFYDVTENMTLLYKIEATFTEPVYPGFWLGDKCSIKLCGFRQGVGVN